MPHRMLGNTGLQVSVLSYGFWATFGAKDGLLDEEGVAKAKEILNGKGIKVYDTIVGPLVTCQEMSGISISFTKLDDELKQLWDMPCESVCYSKMEGPGS